MGRYWCCFQKKEENPQPIVLQDLRIQNPLNLDELPTNLSDLRAMEGALMSHLVSLHYKLEEAKKTVRYEFQTGNSNRAKEALAKRAVLAERKQLFESRLQRVQARLKEIRFST